MARLVFVLDDDPVAVDLAEILCSLDCQAELFVSMGRLLRAAKDRAPDIVFFDELTGGSNGQELSRRIRKDLGLSSVKLVVMGSRTAEHKEKMSASRVVADAWLEKPFGHEPVRILLSRLSQDRAEVRFWGVRGSIASPGPQLDRYGGNTSCVTVRLAMDEYIVFDAGTGIRQFGNYLIQLALPVKVHLLISHAHWDHIQGLPFFRPGYLPENNMVIYGPQQPDTQFEKVIADQMQTTYFPVPLTTMQAEIKFYTLEPGRFEVAGNKLETMYLRHPGNTLGYRLTIRGKSFAYMCDNELADDDPAYRESMMAFIKDADLVVADAQYTPEDFPARNGWGHSKYTDVVDAALQAGVRRLVITHHDPDRTDDMLDDIVTAARERIAKRGSTMECSAAAEGSVKYL